MNKILIATAGLIGLTITGISKINFAVPQHTVITDTIKDIDKIVAGYINRTGAQAELYYGIEHIGYPSKIEGEPYFNSGDWQKGSVVYNGVLYNDVPLKYDLIADDLVVLHPNNYFAITLVKDKISSFSIAGHDFVAMPKNNRYELKPGFYDEVVFGRLTILVKRKRNIEEKIINGEIARRFEDDYDYYAIKDGASYRISNESSIMSLLDDKTRKVRNHLKEKEISFRNMKEFALIEIATYYNQLSQ